MYSKTKINNITNTPLPMDLLKNKELLDVAKDFKETDFFKKYVDKVYLSVDDDLGGFIYFLPKTGYALEIRKQLRKSRYRMTISLLNRCCSIWNSSKMV